ncbi:guanylate kinase [Streptomyces sp. ID05-04B]|uniref:guanylate kinase n=1 Tax=Streptomyces sp. ID05-04B TaxID=3028661 RepID=UPI0029C13D3F|nr:guanylate kinase [Streptomyces sp. ID05-04B]MDX5566616.1 guanylate kinase [Streptomyces sp. ID05-04B]
MKPGVILYGPPAAGKDTVTSALARADRRYEPFTRLKIGSGKTDNYRMGVMADLERLEAAGDVVYRNDRYGNVYVIDRPGLADAFAAGVPVVHLGQVAGVQELLAGYPAKWLTVLLWCPKAVTEQRSQGRRDTDTATRIAVWEETQDDLVAHAGFRFDLTLRTDLTQPPQAARLIRQALWRRSEDPAA